MGSGPVVTGTHGAVPPDTALDEATVDALADRLHRAERERRAIGRLTDERPDLSIEDAYRIQTALLARKLADGERIIGGKLGFTSRAMREALGVSQPNYGWLTDTMVLLDGDVPVGELIHPKVEPEIAFLLGRDLAGSAVGVAHVLAATEAVFACLEVVDSRYEGFRFLAADNIADDSSAARLVLGTRAIPPGDLDLRLLGVVLEVDGEVRATAAGAAAEGHPAAAVAWLVRRLAAESRGLEAGQLVISGGLTRPFDLQAGTTMTVTIDRLGDATLRGRG